MRRTVILVFAGLWILPDASVAPAMEPANPKTNEKARAVLDYFAGLGERSDKRVVSGQFTNYGPNANLRLLSETYEKTGHWPGMIGADYADFGSGRLHYKTITKLCSGYWNKGGLVTICAHLYNPARPDGGGLRDKGVDIEKMITAGNESQTRWMKELDTLAAGLAELKEAGVVVMWRPFHEMNGGWVWWGGKEPERFKKLWRHMFEYFTREKGLDNLLWVYSPNHGSRTTDYYPGERYVDMVGLDIYTDNIDKNTIKGYDEVVKLGKPFGFTEYGPHGPQNPPGDYDYRRLIEGISREFPKTTFFLCWHGGWSIPRNNHSKELLEHPWVVNREDLPGGLFKGEK